MGKPTGFMEFRRVNEGYARLKNALKITTSLSRISAMRGPSSRCSLHGLRHPVLQQRLSGQQHHSRLERPGVSR